MSKNARSGNCREVLHCKCGGTIQMKTVNNNGRMKHYARCCDCDKVARKPKGLM